MFAFRLHQFFTRGDTVWSTLEADELRHLELAKLITKPGDTDKLMFPLVFCRHCGTEYFRVYQTQEEGLAVLRPREDRIDDDDAEEGFLYVSDKSPGPCWNPSSWIACRTS